MIDRMKKLYGSRTSCWFLIVAGACICFALITLTGFLIGVAYKSNINFQNSTTIVAATPTINITGKFNCQQNQYYDNVGKMCVSQKLINETCNSTMECRSDLGLECSNNSVCQCTPSLPLWDPSSNKCAACNSTGNYSCQCPALQYLNTTQNKCVNQSTNGETCSLDFGCRIDLGLSCQSGLCRCNSTYQYWSTISFKCLNYQTYTDTCTSSGRECDQRLKLLCNDGTTCDCPSTSTVNICDCVRVLGNESYWNGTSCTAALTNGTSCQSASTSYMCQTLTQGTVCNITGTSYYCQCPSLQYFNTTQGKCLPQETNLGTCSVNTGCRIDLGLSCVSTVCQCNSTYQFWSTTLFKCVNYKTYAEVCSPDVCDPRASLICNTGTACNCPTSLGKGFCDCTRVSGNENYWNGSSCVPCVSYGSKCVTGQTYECQTLAVVGVDCDSGICQCPGNSGLHNSTMKCISCATNWKYVDPNCYRLGDNVDKSHKDAHNVQIDTSCGKSALTDPQKGTCLLAKLNLPGVVSYFNSIAAGKDIWIDLSGDGKTSYISSDTTWTVSVSGPEWGGTNVKSTTDACVYYTVSSGLFYEQACSNFHYHACQYTP